MGGLLVARDNGGVFDIFDSGVVAEAGRQQEVRCSRWHAAGVVVVGGGGGGGGGEGEGEGEATPLMDTRCTPSVDGYSRAEYFAVEAANGVQVWI